MKSFPKARTERIVVQQLPDEILIYDLQSGQAYCLNQTAALVWQNADGATPISEIARRLQKKFRAPVEESVVWFALKTLDEQNLLSGGIAIPAGFASFDRRRLIAMLGKSAAVAIPLVFSITAPQASHAASNAAALRANGQVCTSDAQCAGGDCGTDNRCCTAVGRRCTTDSECCSSLYCALQGPPPSTGTCQIATGGCVLFDTPITIAGGGTVKAVDVCVGETLLGVNCFNGAMIAGQVRARQELSADEIYSVIAESGDVVHCSPSHPLIRGFGDWEGTSVERFKIGDSLLVHDIKTNRIVEAKTVSVERIRVAQPVILFEMDTPEHTFVSGGIISHNKIVPGGV